MPKRNDISKVMVLGAGPISIGQACEFDYSGTQALKALKEEGLKTVLVNSNPATIMTDPFFSDETFIQPLTLNYLEKIIEVTRPDAILPTVGGQTALNCTLELHKNKVLEKYQVEILGASPEAIEKAENRELFKQAMKKINLPFPHSRVVQSLKEAKNWLREVNLPLIIRPSFTLGGAGGGVAYTSKEFFMIVEQGLKLSANHEVLIDESLLGWKEFEMEVVCDKNNNGIIVCSIENIDPMGVHTGDSITVAPALTLRDKQYQFLRNKSLDVLREIGVTTGGANVQFAIHPRTGRCLIIEMNPRVSRSSALASKATGFPIAKVATKLALGYTLDEIQNDITHITPASFEPTIDYIVTKIPRFHFEKFYKTHESEPTLSTSMKSVGEVMAIGRSFLESLQKGLCSLETGLAGFNEVVLKDIKQLKVLTPYKILYIAQAIREHYSLDIIAELSHIDPWFIREIKKVVEMERRIKSEGLPKTSYELREFKKMGFSDERLAQLSSTTEKKLFQLRQDLNIHPVLKTVDTCAGEFSSHTSYLYSCYESDSKSDLVCEAVIHDRKKVIILGSGPNRIGQGIEFDYTCVHACFTLRMMGIEAIMINCNPETVSTDYDTSDKLYFEPLKAENILAIIDKEKKRGEFLGVIIQCGGQTPINLAHTLKEAQVPLLGTDLKSISLTEDREEFKKVIQILKLKQPRSEICYELSELYKVAEKVGYPVLIRPSYVLGGEAMSILKSPQDLSLYLSRNRNVFLKKVSLLVDSFLENAIELDVDALCDGESVFIAGISEHIERAGVHSGDSACSLPVFSIPEHIVSKVKEQTKKIALFLNIKGFMNIQFALQKDEIFLLEVNPRASRTIPFLEKATGIPLSVLATKIMLGDKIKTFSEKEKEFFSFYSVKEAKFSFERFKNIDPLLSPEMKSIGEVMGIGSSFHLAYNKALQSVNQNIPENCKKVYVSQKAPLELQTKYKQLFQITSSYKDVKSVSFVVACEEDKTDERVRKYAVSYGIPYVSTYEGAYHIIKAYEKKYHEKCYPQSLQELYRIK